MKHDLLHILSDIFTSFGYNVTESYRYDLIAKKNGYITYIKFGSKLDYEEIQNFVDQVENGNGLYVVSHKMPDDLYQYAKEMGLVVWDRDELALQIGNAVLSDIEGQTDNFEPTTETVQQRKIVNLNIGRDDDTPIFETLEQHESQSHISSLETKQPTVLELRSVPLNVTKEKAVSIAKPHLGGVEGTVLKLVPYWRYEYSISIEKQYRSKIVDISGEGAGCLNALNGHTEFYVENIQDQIALPDDLYELKPPVMKEEDAKKDLIKMITEEHTKDVLFENMVGDTIISEHRTLKPMPEDIKLNLDLVYLPIWEVKGPRNSVEINGYSAEVLSDPVDDDVEFM
jgi:hypothetical protein